MPAKRTTNPMGKDNPRGYIIIHGTGAYEGWTWTIRKLYKNPANSLLDPFARAFCAVKSPCTYGPIGDLSDTYINDIPGLRSELQVIANQQEEIK